LLLAALHHCRPHVGYDIHQFHTRGTRERHIASATGVLRLNAPH
jgi:hypothetical protein